MLKVDKLVFNINGKKILNDINITFPNREFNVILGPNGSGKSTLLKLLAGEYISYSGNICYQEKDLKKFSKNDLSKFRSVLSQQPDIQFPIIVKDLIMMGRYPFFDIYPTKIDFEIISELIQLLEIEKFIDRDYLTLSGGEKQRVNIARVLAQLWDKNYDQNKYLFLDEPLNNLDIYYQYKILNIIQNLISKNITIIGILHDLNLALKYGENIIFLKNGEIIKFGKTEKIVNESLIKEVYQLESKIINIEGMEKPFIIF